MKSDYQGGTREIRHDIDGLRALAVVIVLLYHVGFSDIGGGFVGVDVFFVISGYLIIPTVFKQSENGTFSQADFMLRRLRRLVPALLPVLIFSIAVGILYLSDNAFIEHLNSAFSASGFFSNYLFLSQSGYFERSSDTVLLLHTWSLGVEFQFYLILALMPLFMRLRMMTTLVILCVLSLGWAQYLVQVADNRAFFGVAPRFWELAFGGILGLLSGSFHRFGAFGWAMRLIGLCTIVGTAMFYRSTMPFPGFMALLPVVAAGLVVAAPAQKRDPSYLFLTSRVMRWIGTRSYSIYLWHWPLIVALKLIVITPNEGERLAAVLLAFPLAELSYRFVEKPVRIKTWWTLPQRTLLLGLIPIVMLGSVWATERQTSTISAARAYLPLQDGRVIGAWAENARSIYLSQMTELGVDGRQGLCSLDEYETVSASLDCLSSATENVAIDAKQPILIIGDSHGRDMFISLGYAFPEVPLVMLHASGCAPAYYTRRVNSHCFEDIIEQLPAVLSRVDPKLVILASHWPLDSIEPTTQTLDLLGMWGGEVVIIGPGPKFKYPTAFMIRSSDLTLEDLSPDTRLPAIFDFDVYSASAALNVIAQNADTYVYDRLSALCDSTGCLAFTPDSNLRLMNWDDQHLTDAGMRFLANDMQADAQLRTFMLD